MEASKRRRALCALWAVAAAVRLDKACALRAAATHTNRPPRTHQPHPHQTARHANDRAKTPLLAATTTNAPLDDKRILNLGLSSPAPRGALAPDALDELAATDFCELNDYVPTDLVARLVDDVEGLRADASVSTTGALDGYGSVEWFTFGPGSVGAAPPIAADAGGDPAARRELLVLLDNLRGSLEHMTGYEFAPDFFEVQYAYYPTGGYYHRHIDSGSFHTHPGLESGLVARSWSFVLYLNADWSEADGGHLRVYEANAPGAPHRDVAPRAGTAVVFNSQTVPHEVMPSSSRRIAIVGWFNRVVSAAFAKSLYS